MNAEDIKARLDSVNDSSGKKFFKKTGVEMDVKSALEMSLQNHSTPAAFVIFSGAQLNEPRGNVGVGNLRQKETVTFVVLLMLKKSNTNKVSFSDARAKLVDSLFGWCSTPETHSVLQLAGGSMLSVKEGVVWAERFTCTTYQKSIY